MDGPAGTWVLHEVPDTFFKSYLLRLIWGVYRQTKYVSGASDNVINEYAIVINMACDGALDIVLCAPVLQQMPRSLLGTWAVLPLTAHGGYAPGEPLGTPGRAG